MMAWLIMEMVSNGKATTLGMCSGVVAGLVAITPAATFVGTMSSIIFGLVAGVLCFFAIQLKEKFGYDDSLDVVGIHMVAASSAASSLASLRAMRPLVAPKRLSSRLVAPCCGTSSNRSWSYSSSRSSMTFIIAKVIDATIGLRVSDEAEQLGLDTSEHAETAYLQAGTFERR